MKCMIGIRNVFLAYGLVLLVVLGCKLPQIDLPDMPDTLPLPLPTTTTTIPPQNTSDAIDIKAIKWLGDDYSGAVQTVVLTSATISNDKVTFAPAAPSSWGTTIVNGKKCQSKHCVFYERNGITGGFYEWNKPNDTVRSTHNLHTAYHGHSMPVKGSKVWEMYVSVDGKYRSNIIEATWK